MKGQHSLLKLGVLAAPLWLGAMALPGQEAAVAQEASAKALKKELRELERAYKEAVSTVMTEMRELPEAKQYAYYQEHRPKPAEWAPRFFDLAERAVRTDTAAAAYKWVIGNSDDEEHFLISMDALMRDHIDSDYMAEVCQTLMYRDGGDETLKEILDESKNETVLGHATFYLGKKYADGLDWGAGPPDAREQAEAYLEKVVADYADLEYVRAPTLGEEASRLLFAMRNLVVGKVAPDISGEDIEGVDFKLSDYRGKVVMLDFWGHW